MDPLAICPHDFCRFSFSFFWKFIRYLLLSKRLTDKVEEKRVYSIEDRYLVLVSMEGSKDWRILESKEYEGGGKSCHSHETHPLGPRLYSASVREKESRLIGTVKKLTPSKFTRVEWRIPLDFTKLWMSFQLGDKSAQRGSL